jgi:dTDP-4-dehydrorhamnose reductase
MPGLVVHAAALTSVEACEAEPELARHVNVDLAVNVAAACARRSIPLAHISTDHLFSGDRACVDEEQPVAPLNVYGRTKAEAEERVLALHPTALVVRTNFFGWGTSYRRSLSDTILNWLRGGETATLFTDVFFTPILADELASAVLDLAAARGAGVYHVVGDERISKHEFGLRLAAVFGLDATLIRPGLMSDVPTLAQRPHDMSLANARARARLGRSMGGVDTHLASLLAQEQGGRARELQTL